MNYMPSLIFLFPSSPVPSAPVPSAPSSRALSTDEIQLLLSNDVCILEMDAYLVNIEADPSQVSSSV